MRLKFSKDVLELTPSPFPLPFGERIKVRVKRNFPLYQIIKKIAGLAEDKGCKAYLVGGFVRDILLGVKNLDIDIVVEGDAIEFARYASMKTGAALVEHVRFGTATLIMPEAPKGTKVKIDIATARKEFYKYPAALPSVKFSSIKDDLYRRDFTVNAIAVSIDKRDFGELIDFFGGLKDIARKRIRVLHEKSFIDDPTRIFRAVRFEQRYGFRIDDFTARLIKNAVKEEMFGRVSGERLRAEIELLLKEKKPINVVKRMKGLDELRFIDPKIRFGLSEERLCGSIGKMTALYGNYFLKERPIDLWLVYFMAMINRLALSDTLNVCDRFVMSRSDRERIISVKKSGKKAAALLLKEKNIMPSEIYRALEPFSSEALLFIMAKCGVNRANRRVSDFLNKHKGTRLLIKGTDLKRFGAQPGPCFTEILKKALDAKIDGRFSTKQDELSFAKEQIKTNRT